MYNKTEPFNEIANLKDLKEELRTLTAKFQVLAGHHFDQAITKEEFLKRIAEIKLDDEQLIKEKRERIHEEAYGNFDPPSLTRLASGVLNREFNSHPETPQVWPAVRRFVIKEIKRDGSVSIRSEGAILPNGVCIAYHPNPGTIVHYPDCRALEFLHGPHRDQRIEWLD